MKIAEQPAFDLTPDELLEVRRRAFDDHLFSVTDEGVQFHDLSTDQPLEPGQVPPIVWADPLLAEGLDHLAEMGEHNDLVVDLLLSAHGGPKDYADIREAFEAKLENAACVAVETAWKTQPSNKYPLFTEISPDTSASAKGRREFQKVQLDHIKQLGAIAMPCDISDAPDFQSTISEELKYLWSIRGTAHKKLRDPGQIHATRVIAERMYQGVRPWAMLGYLGQWVLQLQRLDLIPDRLTVPFAVGAGHGMNSARLNSRSVPTLTHQVPATIASNPQHHRYRQMMMQASYDHRLDWQALQAKPVEATA